MVFVFKHHTFIKHPWQCFSFSSFSPCFPLVFFVLSLVYLAFPVACLVFPLVFLIFPLAFHGIHWREGILCVPSYPLYPTKPKHENYWKLIDSPIEFVDVLWSPDLYEGAFQIFLETQNIPGSGKDFIFVYLCIYLQIFIFLIIFAYVCMEKKHTKRIKKRWLGPNPQQAASQGCPGSHQKNKKEGPECPNAKLIKIIQN